MPDANERQPMRGWLGTHGAAAWLFTTGVLSMALAIIGAFVAIERPLVMQPYNIDEGRGARYVLELERPSFPFTIWTDDAASGHRSALLIKEDGQALGPGRAPLAQIETGGRGRYRHTGDFIQFSSRDNTDPRTNGRFYHAVYTLVFAPFALWLLLSAGALLAVAGLAGCRRT